MKILVLAVLIVAAARSGSADWHCVIDKATGGLSNIVIDGRTVALRADVPCGVCVEEIASKGGKLVRAGKSGRFSTTVTTAKRGDALFVTAEVRDTKGGDSAADVFYQIPVDTAGWVWHQSILTSTPAGEHSQDLIPISVLANPETGAGLAVAISPDTPCMFAAGCSTSKGLFVKAKVGFSDLTNPPSRAKFGFVVYPVDAKWGMRAALKRYYTLFPNAYEGRSKANGLWIFHGKATAAPNPTQFGFHSVGELGEARQIGKLAVDILTPEEVTQEQNWGIEIYPYVIPGQREVGFLDKLKGDGKTLGMPEQDQTRDVLQVHYSTAEALDILEHMTEKNMTITQAIQPAADYIATVKSSYLIGADGDIVTRPRITAWSDKSLTFPVNPNPSIPTGGAKFNAGTEILNQCRRWLDGPWAGIYVDSLYRWGEYINYRRDHFPCAKYGLTYGPDGRPCLDNSLEHLAFLDELRALVRSRGRNLSANGVRQKCWFAAHRLDVACSEFGTNTDLEGIAFRRSMVYAKPYMSMNHGMKGRDADRRYLGRCFLFGVYGCSDMPYFNTADYLKVKDIYDTYLPIQRRMVPLGWEPITNARVLTEGVLAERFGEGSTIYFSLYRNTGDAATADLEIDCAAIGLGGNVTVADPVAGKKLDISWSNGRAVVRGIALSADGIGVVRIEG